jgi:hypothetical protein
MVSHRVLIRIMGETDIVDVNLIKTAVNAPDGSAFLAGLDGSDQINLLGHWMDQDHGAALADNTAYLDAMTQIASDILANSPLAGEIDAGANFVLLTILREKWPVGSKSRFKVLAERVKADHTYLAHICAAAKLDDLNDEDSLKHEETRQLSLSLAFYKANRRRFANSSAVQGLIKG